MKIDRGKISRIIILLLSALTAFSAGREFLAMHEPDAFYPSAALTREGRLSDYFQGLKGSANDSRLFVYEGEHDGATVLVLGGTHPNEAASFVAATLIIENVEISAGRLIVLPQANCSGYTCTDPMEASPRLYTIDTETGKRPFRFGSRLVNPLDQWPDPLVYSHRPSGQQLSGFETRNLNRSYPGRPDGSLSEKTAYAIMRLIEKEGVDVAFDLHEAAPEIPIINAIVYHEKAEEIALNAVFELEMSGLHYSPELSPDNFHGLSHREWGDYTDANPFLMETSNPIQGRMRGRTNADLIVEGVSPEYKRALESGALQIEYLPTGEPIERRVGRHMSGFKSILNAYNELHEEKIIVGNLPGYDEVMKEGVGAYLAMK
jgi:hypothetical protein